MIPTLLFPKVLQKRKCDKGKSLFFRIASAKNFTSPLAPMFAMLILALLLSCGSKPKDESKVQTNQNDTIATTASEETRVKIDTLNRASIDKEIVVFLSKFNRGSLKSVINKDGVIAIQQGPGVSSTHILARNSEDLLGINELILYLSDSSAMLMDRYYRLRSKCELDESPEGIYVKPITFDQSKLNYYDIVQQPDLALTKSWVDKSGYEIILSFVDKMESKFLLDLIILEIEKKLVLVIIDQRECGV